MDKDIQNYIILGLGIVFIPFAISYRKKINKLKATGIEVNGIVFDFVNHSRMSGNTAGYRHPIIRFLTVENKWITEEYQNSIGLLKKGKKITVIYNPEDPKEFIVNNKSLKFIPTILLIIAAIAICYALINLLK